MALYMVVHTPHEDEGEVVRPPSRMLELAQDHGVEGSVPRWFKTWSPDLHDDRLFSLWDAESADAIIQAIRAYGFLDNMDLHPIQVREWGPDDVQSAHTE